MAIYHCNVAVVSRGDAQSAVASAAYLSRSRIKDERTGQWHDYRRIHEHEELVADLGVSRPVDSPDRWDDRAVLWNDVEAKERADNAQVARRIIVALPDEMTTDEQIALARQIVADRVADGHVVDAAIHRNVEGHNAHLHMLEPLRSVNRDGLMPKSVNVYTVRLRGQEAQMTAAELKRARAAGEEWEKVYTYRRGNQKRRLTPSQASRWEGCKRVGKTPVQTSRYLNTWNDKGNVEVWRSQIAERINEHLARAGYDARVDHRSFERQGIDRPAGVHLGSTVAAIEAKAREQAARQGRPYVPVTALGAEHARVQQAIAQDTHLRAEIAQAQAHYDALLDEKREHERVQAEADQVRAQASDLYRKALAALDGKDAAASLPDGLEDQDRTVCDAVTSYAERGKNVRGHIQRAYMNHVLARVRALVERARQAVNQVRHLLGQPETTWPDLPSLATYVPSTRTVTRTSEPERAATCEDHRERLVSRQLAENYSGGPRPEPTREQPTHRSDSTPRTHRNDPAPSCGPSLGSKLGQVTAGMDAQGRGRPDARSHRPTRDDAR